jgi:hypothetical protein
MKLRHFVSGSAVVLAGWLAVTFFHEVPSQRYPKLDPTPSAANLKDEAPSEAPAISPESAALQVSVSH